MDKVLAHEVAVVGAVAGRRREVDLIEVVDDAVHRVEDGPVGVILPAAVLVHEVVLRQARRRISSRPEARACVR